MKRADTIVLGLGMATLEAQNGVVPMTVADVPGVEISGLIFDAVPVNSPVLLQVGSEHANTGQGQSRAGWSNPNDPIAIHDVFFRIGGPHLGKAAVSLSVNSDNVILDDTWAWRADHGTGVGWTSNTADSGLVGHDRPSCGRRRAGDERGHDPGQHRQLPIAPGPVAAAAELSPQGLRPAEAEPQPLYR